MRQSTNDLTKEAKSHRTGDEMRLESEGADCPRLLWSPAEDSLCGRNVHPEEQSELWRFCDDVVASPPLASQRRLSEHKGGETWENGFHFWHPS